MGSQLWCGGPGHFFTGTGAGGSLQYLGTCEGEPFLDFMPDWEVVLNDLGGSRKPFDRSFQGENCLVRGVFTRWDELVYARIAAVPTPSGTRGGSAFGDIGAFMIQEGLAYQLVVQSPYASKAAFAGMPAGYRFLATSILAPHRFNLGTMPKKISLIWGCERIFVPATGSMLLYNLDMTGLPAIS